jgi:putative endonuclease
MDKKTLGSRGEDIACDFLKKKKYRIVEKNFRTRNGEIDILAVDTMEKPQALVCVEVKVRKGNNFGTARESITIYKLKALERTLIYYHSIHPQLPSYFRIDLVAIELDEFGEISSIDLVKNISQ